MDWLPLLSVQDHTRRSGAEQRDDPKPMASMTPNKKGQDNESNALEMPSCNSSFWDFLFAQGAVSISSRCKIAEGDLGIRSTRTGEGEQAGYGRGRILLSSVV